METHETREYQRPEEITTSGRTSPVRSSADLLPGAYFLAFDGSTCWMCNLPASGLVTIGRAEEAQIRLQGSSVSRLHAEVSISRAGALIRDLGSRNGTCVNGERLDAPHRLRSGDVVQLSGARLVFQEIGSGRPGALSADPGAFRQRLEEEHERSLRSGRPWSVLLIDLGARKASLEAATTAIARSLRQSDVGFWDGDRFATLLLPETDGAGARGAAERLVGTLSELAPEVRAAVAGYPSDGTRPDDVLAASRSNLRLAGPRQVGQAVPAPRHIEIGCATAVVGDGAMLQVFARAERLARGEMPVLVTGETGVGKELVASAVHHWSPRKAAPFVTLNCAAMPEQLVESELFGYQKGAFTGAAGAKTGLLETAHGGTLFLDEIAELPLQSQAKLLRVLETKRLRPLGEVREREVDVRVVTATNRDLELEVAEGRFRKDLYFRLRGATLWVPPLRKRQSDIRPLLETFLEEACGRHDRPRIEISAAVLEELKAYAWPGNVRELRSLADYAAASEGDAALEPGCLSEWLGRASTQPVLPAEERRTSEATTSPRFRPIRDELRDLERGRMKEALSATGGNQTRAAELIRMPIRTFMAKVKSYGLLGSQAAKDREREEP